MRRNLTPAETAGVSPLPPDHGLRRCLRGWRATSRLGFHSVVEKCSVCSAWRRPGRPEVWACSSAARPRRQRAAARTGQGGHRHGRRRTNGDAELLLPQLLHPWREAAAAAARDAHCGEAPLPGGTRSPRSASDIHAGPLSSPRPSIFRRNRLG